MDFQDTETAFADKTNDELRKRYRLFKMMNSEAMVSVGTKAAAFALRIGLPVKGIIKDTIFHQFCGGETIEECEATVQKLGKANIGTILDYAIEGKTSEEDFESTKNEIYRTITRAKEDDLVPFAVFKVTGIVPFDILEKVSSGKELLKNEEEAWERAKGRMTELCEYAHSLEQQLFIDAEESWIQDAIDAHVTEMMERFNKEKPIIFNTLQLYRTDRLEFLKKSHEKAKNEGYFLAVKLVRGAYMEKERERAAEMGYPSPIYPDKESTDKAFDAAGEYCLENVEEICCVVGTHNEKSVELLVEKMEKKGIPHNHPNIHFSQLYGMSDNISYVLGKNGYNVTKYVPYGPIKEAVPYLMRRAEENTSVGGQVNREVELTRRELQRRRIV